MLGVIYDEHAGTRVTFDSVDYKTKFIYFNNSLLGTSYIVGTKKGTIDLIKEEINLLIIESFHTNVPISLTRIKNIQSGNMVAQESKLKKGKLNVRTLQELQMNGLGEVPVYMSTRCGFHKIKNITYGVDYVMVETTKYCFVLTVQPTEYIQDVHYMLSTFVSRGTKKIVTVNDIQWEILHAKSESITIEVDKRRLTHVK